MSKTEFKQIINVSKERTWEVLFSQYGDIHIHNPGMPISKYVGNSTKGELNAKRYCTFNDKLNLEEKITEVDELKSFKVVVYEHNLPFMKEMSAIYELSSIGDDKTELKMTSIVSTSPSFMIYMMKGQLGKGLIKHLFGLKYYLETGKIVNNDDYLKTFKSYK
ncbi:MAG: hypothetical protein ACI8ZM_000114 [Crocinitomix sp.]|jgi:hypothetical protein